MKVTPVSKKNALNRGSGSMNSVCNQRYARYGYFAKIARAMIWLFYEILMTRLTHYKTI